jgi:hypothetical protein
MKLGKINYLNLSLNTPVFGAIGGICSGISIRLWQGIPSDFKFPSKSVKPLYPLINSTMQTLFKGPGKYVIALAPITFLTGKAVLKSYRENQSESLKDRCFSYESIFTVSLLALTLFSALTHAYWFSSLGDLSEHVLMVIGFTSILSMGMQALLKSSSEKQKMAYSLFGIFAGIASSIFLFNTTRYYHTMLESVAALQLGACLCGISHLIAEKYKKEERV